MTPPAQPRLRHRVGRPPGPAPDPEARREEILDAAERVIRERGPDVGMSDIAAGIGLTKPAVYRSVGDKAELSAALARRVAERLAADLRAALAGPGEVREVVRAAIDVFCRFVDEDTNLFRFVVHGSIGTRRAGAQDRPLVTGLGEAISAALSQALDQAGADRALADTWAYAILGAVFTATEHWRRHRHITRRQVVDQLTSLVVPALEAQGITSA